MANYTVLLIDYDPRSIERARRPLAAAGYRVQVASDGLTGMKRFEELQPDLVLVEAMIPKKHGFELCHDLKKTPQGRRTPVIIMTSVYKGRKYRTQALHIYQCDEYLEKPVSDDDLIAIVRRFIGDPPASLSPPPPPSQPQRAAASFGGGSTNVDSPEIEVIDGDELPEIELIDMDEEATPPPSPAPSRPVQARPAAPPVQADELEIMERLDAIIPGSTPSKSGAPRAQSMAPAPEIEVIEIVSEPEESPSNPEARSQVVSFADAKRQRKAKKHRGGSTSKGSGAAAASPATGQAAAHAVFERVAPAETAISREAVPTLAVNPAPGTAAAIDSKTDTWSKPQTAADDPASGSGVPGWMWVIALAGLAVAAWFLVG